MDRCVHASAVLYLNFLRLWLKTSLVTSMLQIYSAGVSVFLGGNKPSRTGDVRGDICINFSCDPEISSKLVGIV